MHDLDRAERDTVHRHAGERGVCDQRIHLPVGIECVVHPGVLPGDLRAGGIAVDLIEQVPGVRMAGAERGGVHFAPAQLQVHRRARLVIGRNGTTANRLVDEGGRIEPEHLLVRGKSGQRVETEVRRSRRAGDLDGVSESVGADLDVAVRVVHGRVTAGERIQLRLQLGHCGDFAGACAEGDRQRRIGGFNLDGHRLTLRGRALRQQVGRLDRADRQAELGKDVWRRAGDVDRVIGRRAFQKQMA